MDQDNHYSDSRNLSWIYNYVIHIAEVNMLRCSVTHDDRSFIDRLMLCLVICEE